MILEGAFGHNVVAYVALEEETNEYSFQQPGQKYYIQLSQEIHHGHLLGGISILDGCHAMSLWVVFLLNF